MKFEIFVYKGETTIQLEPETVEEATKLARLSIRGNFNESKAMLNFNESGTQTFRVDIPNYKNRDNRSLSMIRNKDCKII
ncbi:MAG: hypothetical protein UZ05_CHB002000282 [Chlorobi bacterium OLB5]|nr:MAG: hypothetical protein UZ05_CHB002000282 [Chlorobi bacterium OLB5]